MLQNNRKTHSGVSEPDAGEGLSFLSGTLKAFFATWTVLDFIASWNIYLVLWQNLNEIWDYFQTGLEMNNKTFVMKYQTDLFEFQRI